MGNRPKFSDGDIVEMILDLDKKWISVKVNDNDEMIVTKSVKVRDDIEYCMAVSLKISSIEILDYFED